MKRKEKKQAYRDYDHVELVTRVNDLDALLKESEKMNRFYSKEILNLEREIKNRDYVFNLLMDHINDLKMPLD